MSLIKQHLLEQEKEEDRRQALFEYVMFGGPIDVVDELSTDETNDIIESLSKPE